MSDRTRLRDLSGLRIEVPDRVVADYSHAAGISADDARTRLRDIILRSRILGEDGDEIRLRERSGGLDHSLRATRLDARHVRIENIGVRTNRQRGGRGDKTWRVRAASLKGHLRVDSRGVIEWRDMAEGHGAAPPPWRPMPPEIRDVARQQAADGDERLLLWLQSRGIDCSTEPPT